MFKKNVIMLQRLILEDIDNLESFIDVKIIKKFFLYFLELNKKQLSLPD